MLTIQTKDGKHSLPSCILLLSHYMVSYGNRCVHIEPGVAVEPVLMVDGDMGYAAFFEQQPYLDICLFGHREIRKAQRTQFVHDLLIIPAHIAYA